MLLVVNTKQRFVFTIAATITTYYYLPKEREVKINIRFGAIDSDLDYCPASIFAGGTSTIMHHFSVKFNITPFK
jgi:hypothetical protein